MNLQIWGSSRRGLRCQCNYWAKSTRAIHKAMPADEDGWTGAIPDPDDIAQLTRKRRRFRNGVSVNMWHCHSTLLTHPMAHFNPLQKKEKELRDHVNTGHLNKRQSCKACLLSEGPRRVHRRVRDVDRATHVLHINIAGPLTLLQRIPRLPCRSPQTPGPALVDRRAVVEDQNVGGSLSSLRENDRVF